MKWSKWTASGWAWGCAALVVSAATVFGSTVAHTDANGTAVAPSYDAENKTGTWTFTVTPATGETINDFHLKPKLKGTVSGLPSGWTSTGPNKEGLHLHTSNSQTPATLTGPMTFTVSVAGVKDQSKFDKLNKKIDWVTRSDGNADPDDGVVDSGPDHTDLAIFGPMASVDVGGGGPIPPGSSAAITLDGAGVNGLSYTMYAVSTLDGAPDPWDDYAGFIGHVVANPVASTWGVTITDPSGSLDQWGDGSGPIVSVGSSAPVGGEFYVVALVEMGGDYGDARLLGELTVSVGN